MSRDTAARPGESDSSTRGLRLPEAAWYALVAAAAVLGEYVVLQLWRANLSVPFDFSGDAVGAATSIKGLIENGWIWLNPNLGAPGVMNTLDFPGNETLNYLVLKLLSVSGSAAATLNLYFLLTFPVIALSAAWALRKIGISRSAAFAASILFAFLPYHVMRSETHLFLSGYYMIPPLVFLAVGLWGSRPAFLAETDSGATVWRFRSKDSAVAIAICILAASSGIYYAIFGCFFIGMAALWGWWRTGQRIRMLAGLALIGVVFLGVCLNLVPYIAYRFTAPANGGAVVRSATGAELYSLRTALMVLPVRDHRVGLLAFVHQGYVSGLMGISPTMDNESDYVTLGTIATFGFLFLLLVLLFGTGHNRARAPGWQLLQGIAMLTGAALLLANSGMFGTIIGVVFTAIRAYNRIVVFVAFFALIAVALGLDWLGARFASRSHAWRVWGFPVLAVAIAVLGVWDQTTPAMVPAYEQVAAEWDGVGDFVAEAESGLAPGAMVFQLPYVPFPEYPPVVRMLDYDHFKPYLRSSKAHWSYGAVKGREAAAWNAATSQLPPGQLVSAVQAEGFAGIWIDRHGYEDGAAQVIGSLTEATGAAPTTSANGRYAFFSLGR